VSGWTATIRPPSSYTTRLAVELHDQAEGRAARYRLRLPPRPEHQRLRGRPSDLPRAGRLTDRGGQPLARAAPPRRLLTPRWRPDRLQVAPTPHRPPPTTQRQPGAPQ
jgi:hypothetical protein